MNKAKSDAMFNKNDIVANSEGLSSEDVKALEEYFKSVEILSEKGLNLEFNNKDQFHAVIVMSHIYKTAKERVRIFAGEFSGHVSDSPMYRRELSSTVSRGVALEVVFEKQPNEQSLCLKELLRLKKEGRDISICVVKEEFRAQLHALGLSHFTVGDDKMFRYETDKSLFRAICNFDDKKTAATLNKNFDVLKLNAAPIV